MEHAGSGPPQLPSGGCASLDAKRVRPADHVQPAQALAAGERGRLGDRPPRAAQRGAERPRARLRPIGSRRSRNSSASKGSSRRSRRSNNSSPRSNRCSRNDKARSASDRAKSASPRSSKRSPRSRAAPSRSRRRPKALASPSARRSSSAASVSSSSGRRRSVKLRPRSSSGRPLKAAAAPSNGKRRRPNVPPRRRSGSQSRFYEGKVSPRPTDSLHGDARVSRVRARSHSAETAMLDTISRKSVAFDA